MPLLDHFRPPLAPRRHRESFHANWAGAIADALNEDLPEGYFAEEKTHQGARIEIDMATFRDDEPASEGSIALQPTRTWAPPEAPIVLPAAIPDTFEVLVFRSEGGAELVAAIALVSPADKERPAHVRAFAIKAASYPAQGVSLIVIDIVTTRHGNPHNEIVKLLQYDDACMPDDSGLNAVAYRPIVRDGAGQVDVWPMALEVGGTLPALPLALDTGTCLRIDFEETYTAACERRRRN